MSEFPKDVELTATERLALRELNLKCEPAMRILAERDVVVREILEKYGGNIDLHRLNALDPEFTKLQIVERDDVNGNSGPDGG